MNNKPLFSILIANYNNGCYLEACLQSIFAQTYKYWEIVIVDDASTDNSSNIYKKYADYTQIKILKNRKNKGCGFTKRKCVSHASGNICGFVDPDDALLPDALEIMVKHHLDNPAHSIIYTTHYICDENLNPLRIADYVGQIPPEKKYFTLQLPIISHFATFKRSKYGLTNGISKIYPKAVDKDLYFKLEETGPVLFVDRPMYYYRHHANSISLNQQAHVAQQYELTIRALALLRQSNPSLKLREMSFSKTQLVGGMMSVANYELRKLHFAFAIQLLWKSFSFAPSTTIKVILKKIKALL